MVQIEMPAQATEVSGSVFRSSGNAFQRGMNDHLGTRFELTPIGSRNLEGEIARTRVTRHMRLADIRFSAHSTRLLPAGRARSRDEYFLVSWQREGRTTVSQSGRETEIGPGNIFVLDTTKPFNIETTDIWTRSVYLRGDLVRDGFPELSSFTAVPFSDNGGPGRICALMLEELFENAERLEDSGLARYALGLPHLLAIALTDPSHAGSHEVGLETQTAERIKRIARENLSDPDLNCDFISREAGLSVRQIHQLFQSQESRSCGGSGLND